MRVSYNRLRHLLIDRDMKKIDLERAAGITHYQMYKIGNDKDVTTAVLRAICTALHCQLDDIMEFVQDDCNDVQKCLNNSQICGKI